MSDLSNFSLDILSGKCLTVHSRIFSIRLGVFLRRYPIARIFVIIYMVSTIRQRKVWCIQKLYLKLCADPQAKIVFKTLCWPTSERGVRSFWDWQQGWLLASESGLLFVLTFGQQIYLPCVCVRACMRAGVHAGVLSLSFFVLFWRGGWVLSFPPERILQAG